MNQAAFIKKYMHSKYSLTEHQLHPSMHLCYWQAKQLTSSWYRLSKNQLEWYMASLVGDHRSPDSTLQTPPVLCGQQPQSIVAIGDKTLPTIIITGKEPAKAHTSLVPVHKSL